MWELTYEVPEWCAHEDAAEDGPAADDHDDRHEREADRAEGLQEEDTQVLHQDGHLDEEETGVIDPD